MCGISGVYCRGDQRLTPPELHKLLLANEWRGRDASGVAWLGSHGIMYIKRPLKASEFIAELGTARWEEIAQSPIVLLHTRAKTKGSSAQEENNHPVVGFNWVVTHNGVIMNDDDLFDTFRAERFAEVDTSAIPLVLSQGTSHLDSLRWLSVLQGSASIAAWSPQYPRELALARIRGNVVNMSMDITRNLVVWSSDIDGTDVVRPQQVGPLVFYPRSVLPDNHVLVLQPDGQNRLFSIPPAPFFRPKTVTPAVVTPPTTATSQRKTTGYVYIPANHGAYPTKPPPVFDVNHLTWTYCDLIAVVKRFVATPSLVSENVVTPYGTWRIYSENGGIYRTFHPVKRVKKFFARTFGNGHLLPVTSAMAAIYDDKMALERLDIQDKDENENTVQTFGYACPWCMVWHRLDLWKASRFRCRFCGIAVRVQGQ